MEVAEAASGLHEFNGAPVDQLLPGLLTLTASPAWAQALVAGRPYHDVDALLATSDEQVLGLDVAQIDLALAEHPRIGERAGGGDQLAAARSAREQAAMSSADGALQEQMARGNADYEQRFGRIYLVAATGRSADELLELLQARLGNDPDTELEVVRDELARITRIRLIDMLSRREAL